MALLAAFGLGDFVDVGDTIWPPIGVDIADRVPTGPELEVEFQATNNGPHAIQDVAIRCLVHQIEVPDGVTLENIDAQVIRASEGRLGSGESHDFRCNLAGGEGSQFFDFADRHVTSADLTVGLVFQPTLFGFGIPWWKTFGGQRVKGEWLGGEFRWRRAASR